MSTKNTKNNDLYLLQPASTAVIENPLRGIIMLIGCVEWKAKIRFFQLFWVLFKVKNAVYNTQAHAHTHARTVAHMHSCRWIDRWKDKWMMNKCVCACMLAISSPAAQRHKRTLPVFSKISTRITFPWIPPSLYFSWENFLPISSLVPACFFSGEMGADQRVWGMKQATREEKHSRITREMRITKCVIWY